MDGEKHNQCIRTPDQMNTPAITLSQRNILRDCASGPYYLREVPRGGVELRHRAGGRAPLRRFRRQDILALEDAGLLAPKEPGRWEPTERAPAALATI
jgi:hypothetical protein